MVLPFILGLVLATGQPRVEPATAPRNELFPDPVTNDLRVVFAGGGIRVRVGARFTVLGDARFTLAAEND